MSINRRLFLKLAGFGTLACATGLCGAEVPGAGKPNILFFFPDQHRYDWTSMNPEMPDITPNLKQMAKEGTYFTLAFCPSPICSPSRACLATGMEYAGCGVRSNEQSLPLDMTTFYQLLRDKAGYHVMGCGKFDLDKPGKSWGADGKHQREGKPSLLEAWGFSDGIDNPGKLDGKYSKNPDPYEAYLKTVAASASADEKYSDNWIARNGLELIAAAPKDKPWFLQINYNGPHDPFDPTESMVSKWKDAKFPKAVGSNKDAGGERMKYGAEIWNIDRWIAVYKEELRKRGELENTIIVFSSDHGEMLGDHNYVRKSRPLSPSACVPLVISGPGMKQGQRYDKAAETLDLVATFLDYAGVPVPENMDSKSMRAYLEGKGEYPRSYITCALGRWQLVCDGRYKYIAGSLKGNVQASDAGKNEVLYDLAKDPGETVDVLADNPEVAEKLRSLLSAGRSSRSVKNEESNTKKNNKKKNKQ